MAVLIKSVEAHSVAQSYGICAGDTLIRINGEEINDMLDLQFYQASPTLELILTDFNGQEKKITIQGKEQYTPLGLEFETYLIDKHHFCKNKCIFCFIDQLPKGMRETLYFKDDDERLSFLFGNYITLTNLTQKEIDRIKKVRISPINISVHTTNPELRVAMMKNPQSAEILEKMQEFAQAEIKMNCQIVLCKGVNDGEELTRTIQDLQKLYPAVQSVSIVPIGLTRYRENLYPAQIFSSQDAAQVILQVQQLTQEFYETHGTRLIYLSDEFYLNAQMPIPHCDYYEDFPQIENGVGMVRTFIDNFEAEIEEMAVPNQPIAVDIGTGESFYPVMFDLAQKAMEKAGENLKIYVHLVKNQFFGGNVTVTGLLTGSDFVKGLQGKLQTNRLCLCKDVLMDYQDLFLDDMTPQMLEQQLNTSIEFYTNDGYDLLSGIMKERE